MISLLGSSEAKPMSIHQTKKETSDKKLQKIHEQLHGKGNSLNISSKFTYNSHLNTTKPISNTAVTDIAYLNHSLIKIFILSFLALGAQLLLFYLEQNHYINLNFLF